eukprot:m.118269 g.118269  ORF g.118269 m.118269 type:complete len:426 (+) comp14276_c0_seq2:164-1441(+)
MDPPVTDTLQHAESNKDEWPIRTSLPVKHTINPKDASFWGILKSNIGKNLTKISMPININEPLSALQRLCEEFEHSNYLDEAAKQDDPLLRLLNIATFAVSGYASSFCRAGRKPFNPILGETYEYVDHQKKFRLISEQVSHHPPLAAGFIESDSWEVACEVGVETKLRVNKLKLVPTGEFRLHLPKYKEHYTWGKVTTSVEDIFSGNRWVDHYGTMEIKNLTTGHWATVKFSESAMFKKERRRDVSGAIYKPRQATGGKSKEKKGPPPVYTFKGKWNGDIVCPELGNKVLFSAPMVSEDRVKEQYGFSAFACNLNALPKEGSSLQTTIAPTDSRFRPDQRMYESNKSGAQEEKLRVEQAQRDREAQNEAANSPFKPVYFKPQENMPQEGKAKGKSKADHSFRWEYQKNYWKHKESSSFESSPKLW